MKKTQRKKNKNDNRLLDFIEKRVVILSALVVLITLYFILPTWNNINRIDLILTTLITIIVTLIGTLITALTILIAIMNTKSVKTICKNNLWGSFINYFISPILTGISSILYILYTMYILKTTYINKVDIILISMFSIMFIVGILRVGYILILIMKQIPDLEYNDDNSKGTEIDKNDIIRNLK